MADNIDVTPGTGKTIAADEVGGALHQRVKISQGADGSATDVSSAAPLQVTLANTGANSTAVKVDGSAVTQPVSGTVTVQDGGGNISIDDGGNTITVDGTVTANAGTNLNTSALALESGGNLAAAATSLAALDNAVAGNELQVDIVSGNVTNAGTFAVQVDGSALTALQLIDNPVAVLGTATYTEATTSGFVIGAVRRDADTTLVNTTNEIAPLQVDANGYLKVEVFDGGGSHTVDNAGTFAVQVDGSALTALQLIDDAIYVDDADWTGDTSKHVLVGGVRQDTYQTVTDGDVAPFMRDANGKLMVDGGKAFTVSAAPTVTAGAYSVDDVLGAKMTLTAAARVSGGSGVLTGISMFDEGAAGLGNTIDVFIFNADPSGSTFTDNAALAIVDADGPKIIACAKLDQIFDTGDGKYLTAANLNVPYVCSGSANLYAVAVHRGTWAPDATDGITFTFHMVRD